MQVPFAHDDAGKNNPCMRMNHAPYNLQPCLRLYLTYSRRVDFIPQEDTTVIFIHICTKQ